MGNLQRKPDSEFLRRLPIEPVIRIDDALLDVNARNLAFHKPCVALADHGHDPAHNQGISQLLTRRAQVLLRAFAQHGLGKESRHPRF